MGVLIEIVCVDDARVQAGSQWLLATRGSIDAAICFASIDQLIRRSAAH